MVSWVSGEKGEGRKQALIPLFVDVGEEGGVMSSAGLWAKSEDSNRALNWSETSVTLSPDECGGVGGHNSTKEFFEAKNRTSVILGCSPERPEASFTAARTPRGDSGLAVSHQGRSPDWSPSSRASTSLNQASVSG